MDCQAPARGLQRFMTVPRGQDGAAAQDWERQPPRSEDRSQEEDEALPPRDQEPEPETRSHGPLQVVGRLEHRRLRRPLAGRSVFGLVTLEARVDPQGTEAEAAPQPELPMDLVCVVDVSGSMAGPKMDQLKAAVSFLAETLRDEDRLALVVFNDDAACVQPLRRMTAAGRDGALAAVARHFRAGGGTSIVAGLAAGLGLLERRRHRNATAGLLLLTDGLDGGYAAARQLEGMPRRAEAAGAALYCLGFGRDHDAALLGRLAEASRTPFAYVAEPTDLAPAFAGVVGGLAGVGAQHVALRLRPAPGAPWPQVTTYYEVLRTDAYLEVRIPDVCLGERRDVPLEWILGAEDEAALGEAAVPLLTASVRYYDPHGRVFVAVEEASVLEAELEHDAAEGQPEDEPDLEVAVQRARCEGARALEEAAALGRCGDLEGARRVVEAQRALAQALLARVSTAPCVSLLSDLERASRELTGCGRWDVNAEATVRAAAHGQALQRHVTAEPGDRHAAAAQRRWTALATAAADE